MTNLDKVKQDVFKENPYKFLLIELIEASQTFTETCSKILEQFLSEEEKDN